PLTGLGSKQAAVARLDARLGLYRAARTRLLEAGYEQVSMRFFRRPGTPAGPDTCCQEDGTIGLGCGARSYTRRLHYSFEWATDQASIRGILSEYVQTSRERFGTARHGVWLSPEEQRRRYALKTLLRTE